MFSICPPRSWGHLLNPLNLLFTTTATFAALDAQDSWTKTNSLRSGTSQWEWKWFFNNSTIMRPDDKIIFIEKLIKVLDSSQISKTDFSAVLSRFNIDYKSWSTMVLNNCNDPIIRSKFDMGHYTETWELVRFLRNVLVHYNEQQPVSVIHKATPAKIVGKLEEIFPGLWEVLRNTIKDILLDPTMVVTDRDSLKDYFFIKNNKYSVAADTTRAIKTTISDILVNQKCPKNENGKCKSVRLSGCDHQCLYCHQMTNTLGVLEVSC